MQDVGDNLWYPMQHDEVVAQDTAAALEGLDITCTAVGMPRGMSSSDLECAQAEQDWQDYDVTEQKGQYHATPPARSAQVHAQPLGGYLQITFLHKGCGLPPCFARSNWVQSSASMTCMFADVDACHLLASCCDGHPHYLAVSPHGRCGYHEHSRRVG